MPIEEPAKSYLCASCDKPVKEGALLCPHCGARQKPAWSLRRMVAVAGIVVTVLSLAFAIEKLVGIYRTWSATRSQVQKHLAAVDTLVAVGDYASAWNTIEQAQNADPTSARVRMEQVRVATAWIVDGQPVPTSWSPVKSAGAGEPAISSGRAAEQVSHALALASAFAGGSADADLLALTIWAQFLRSRELLTQRRNFGPDLVQTAAGHPRSHLASLFAGHWLAVMAEDPQSAWPYWEQAMTGPKEMARTRRFQIAALGRGLQSRDEPRHSLSSSMLITVLNDMRLANESIPGTLVSNRLTRIWLDRQNRFDLPDRWPLAPPPAEQLETLAWLSSQYEFSAHSAVPTLLRYVRARLLEEAGRPQEALTAYREADLSRASHRLAALFDQAVERLGGAPPPDVLVRDQWRRYTYHVSTLPPDSREFQTALQAIQTEAGQVIDYGDPTLGGRFPPALDAAIAGLAKWTQTPTGRPGANAGLEQQLQALTVARGRLHNRLTAYTEALRDLEPVSTDLQAPRDLRAAALAYIAEVYADRSRRRVHSPDGNQLWEADIQEGFDRLQAAVAAGFSDWDWIESRLSPLRRHPGYVKLSVEHGRLPPREENDN